jgi:hypothetical protein
MGDLELAISSNDRLGFCPRCGEFLPEELTLCPKCGLPIKEAIPQLEPIPFRPNVIGSTRSLMGAVCLVLSGLIGLTMSLFVMLNQEAIVAEIVNIYGGELGVSQEAVTFLIVFWLVAGVTAFIGGFFAAQRRHFKIAMIGGVFALGTFGLVFLEGSVMGLIGLILVFLSRREFR